MNVQSWIVLLLFMTLMGYILFRQIRLIASGRKKCNACTVTVCPMNEPAPVESEADCIAGTIWCCERERVGRKALPDLPNHQII